MAEQVPPSGDGPALPGGSGSLATWGLGDPDQSWEGGRWTHLGRWGRPESWLPPPIVAEVGIEPTTFGL